MPNGHLIYPAWNVQIVTDAVARAVDLIRQFNSATFLSVLIWMSLGITIVLGAIAFIRRNT